MTYEELSEAVQILALQDRCQYVEQEMSYG